MTRPGSLFSQNEEERYAVGLVVRLHQRYSDRVDMVVATFLKHRTCCKRAPKAYVISALQSFVPRPSTLRPPVAGCGRGRAPPS